MFSARETKGKQAADAGQSDPLPGLVAQKEKIEREILGLEAGRKVRSENAFAIGAPALLTIRIRSSFGEDIG